MRFITFVYILNDFYQHQLLPRKKLVLRGVITSPDIRRATNIRWLGLGIGYQGMWVSALQEIRRHSPYPQNVPPIATLTYYSSSSLESTDMELGAATEVLSSRIQRFDFFYVNRIQCTSKHVSLSRSFDSNYKYIQYCHFFHNVNIVQC